MAGTEPPAGPDPATALAREVDRLARRLADADLPGLAADLMAVTARADETAARADRTDAALKAADGHIRGLAQAIKTLAGPGSGGPVSWLLQGPPVGPPAAGQAGGPGGQAGGPPDPPARFSPEEAAARLDDLAQWLADVYLRYPGTDLPSCWAWHPAVVEELHWLRGAHAEAHTGKGAAWATVGNWHDRLRPGVAKRISGWIGTCDLSRHRDPEGDRRDRGTPAVPLAAHLELVAACWSAGCETPVPDQLALDEAETHDRTAART